MPDGSEQEIAVAITFAADENAPDATMFTCQRTNSEAFLNETFVSHPNGAEGVLGVTAVAQEPAGFRDLLSAATGGEVEGAGDGLRVEMDGGALAIVTPGEFALRYGVESPDARRGLILAAVDLGVADLDRAIGYAGPTATRHGGRIVVPPSAGLGALLAFGTTANG